MFNWRLICSFLILLCINYNSTICQTAIPVHTIESGFKVLEPKHNFSYHSSGSVFFQKKVKQKANLPYNHSSFGMINTDVDIETKLINSGDEVILAKLEVGNSTLDKLLIQFDGRLTSNKSHLTGDNFRFWERPYNHRNFVFPIEILPKDTLTIKIKLLAQREAAYIPFRIIEEGTFIESASGDFLLLGGILGLYAIYIIFILSLFGLVRNRLFLFYSILNSFVLLYCVFDTGIGFQLYWNKWPIIQDLIIPFVGFGYIFSMILFAREFFSSSVKYPIIDKIFIGYLVLDSLAFIVAVVCYFFAIAPIFVPLMILSFILVVYSISVTILGIITYYQAGRREGFWFLVLFGLHLVMWLFLMNQRGYFGLYIISPDSLIYNMLPFYTGTPDYLFVYMFAEILIVSAIIAFRFQDVIEEYNVSHRRINEINKNSIKDFIKGQEVERSILANQLEKRIGLNLKSIESDIKGALDKRDSEVLNKSLDQLHNVQDDLYRIASDHVVNWNDIEATRLVQKVFEQLELALPETSISIDMADDIKRVPLSDLIKLNLYRILQEVCNNIIKHADAEQVNAAFSIIDDNLIVEIKDNGKGFDTNAVELKSGIGLMNIETRAKALNGALEVNSDIEKGTEINVKIPLEGYDI